MASIYDNAFSANKAEGLAARKFDKVQNLIGTSIYDDAFSAKIQPTATPFTTQTVDRLVDADSAILRGQPTETRFNGFDAYEVQHTDPVSLAYFKSPAGIKKMERQKEHLAQQLGIDVSSVSTDMIYKEGEKQKLDALYTFMGRPKDPQGKEWAPGPINYSPTKDGAIPLGTTANPLGVKIQAQDLGKDYYGRGLSNVADTHGKLLTDRFNTPSQNTDYGTVYNSKQNTPKSNWGDMPGTPGNGRLSEDIAIAKSAGIQLGAGAIRMVNKAATTLGLNGFMDKVDAAVGGTGHAGMYLKDKNDLPFTNKTVKEVLDPQKGQAVADAMADMSPESRVTFSTAMKHSETQWDKGDYLGSMWTSAQHLDKLLGQSLPEMAVLFIPYAGAATVAATRASNQAEVFKENNQGKEYDASQYAGSFLANLALLLPEKLLIKSGITDVFSKAIKGGHTAAVAKSVLGETAQEYGEGIQEAYATQKEDSKTLREIATSSSAVFQGAVGGLMGGSLHLGGLGVEEIPTVLGATKDIAYSGLNKLAEVSANRTKADVLAKNLAKQKATAEEKATVNGTNTTAPQDLTTQVESRRVPITETMTTGEAQVAEKVNSSLDKVYEVYSTNPESVGEALKGIDALKDSLGLPTASIIDTTETTTNIDTTGSNTNTSKATTEDSPLDRTTKLRDLVKEHKTATESLTDEEYTDYKEVEVVSRLAAIEKLGSLFDKAKNVGLELIKGDSTSLKNKSSKKNSQYKVEAISDTVLTDMINGKGVSDTVDTESLSGNRMSKGLDAVTSAKVHRIKDELQKVQKAMTPEVTAILSKIVAGDTATEADIVRILAIGISAVQDHIVAETNKSGTTDVAREDTLAVQLGKEHINSFGVNVTGESTAVASVNKERGTLILDFLEQVGIIERSEDLTELSAKDTVGQEHTKIKPGDVKAIPVSKTGNLLLHTVSLTKYYRATEQAAVVNKDGTIKQDAIAVNNSVVSAMNMVNRLFNPVNNESVSNSPQETVIAHKAEADVKLSKEHEQVLKDYSKLKYGIKLPFMKLLKELRGMLDSTGTNNKGIIDFDKFFQHPDVVALLGTNKNVPQLLKDSELGKFIGRSGSLAKVLENLDAIELLMTDEDGFNFHYESAINERIHVLQTVLDFQGDKYMARQMITGGEEIVKEGPEAKMLINEIASELNSMMGTDLSMVELLEQSEIKAIAETGDLSLQGLLKAKKNLGIEGLHSPFKLLSVLQGMKDISKAYDGTSIKGSIPTSYVVQNDARASGVMNTLMNLSGIKAVQDILAKIWSGVDPYTIVSDKVLVLFTQDKYAKADAITKSEELGIAIKSKAFMRDLAKFLVMPWFYGQSGENAKKTFGDSVATKLYEDAMLANSAEAFNLIVKITGNKDLFNYNKEDLAVVAEYFAKDLGETYVKAVEESFPEVIAYRNIMGAVFKMLEKTKQWNGSIRSPFAAMENSNEKMSVKKLKSVMLQDTTSTPLTVNQMLNNETSFKVNLQHGVDAAILLNVMKKLMEEFTDLKGTMTVHDAIYSTPAVAMKAVKYYNEFVVDAAIEYDFMDEALNELETAAKAMESGNQVQQLALDMVSEYRAKNDIAMEEKRKFLGDRSLSVMGEGGIEAETYNARKPAKDTKQSKVDQARTELKERVQKNRDVISKVTTQVTSKDLLGVISTLKDAVGSKGKSLLVRMKEALEKGVRIEFAENGEFQAVQGVVLIPKDMTRDPINSLKNSNVEMTPEVLVEILAHEVDHAVQVNWIRDNVTSDEVRYIKRALDKVLSTKGLSRGMNSRIAHMSNPISEEDITRVVAQTGKTREQVKTAYQVSEFSSMMNESEFSTEVAKILQPSVFTTLMNRIKDLIGKAYTTMAEFLNDTGLKDISELDITMDITQEALRMLQDQALDAFIAKQGPVGQTDVSSKATATSTATRALDKVGQSFQRADSVTADFMVIWGDAFYEMVVPNVVKSHKTMYQASRTYKLTTDALNTFVFDSDFMKRTLTRLGVAGDNMQQLQSDMLTDMNAYMQESSQLAEDLTTLRRSITSKHTSKEAIDIWKIFTGTNISELTPVVWERLLSGVSSIETMAEAIANTLTVAEKTTLDTLATYYSSGVTTDGNTNLQMANVLKKDAAVYVALKGLSAIQDSQKLLASMDKELVQMLQSLAISNSKLNSQINRLGLGENGLRYSPNATFNINYDGTYLMDVVDIGKEVVVVTAEDMATMLKAKGGKAWTVISKPEGDTLGVMVRENMTPLRTAGVGLSINRFVNGVMVEGKQAEAIQAKLGKIVKESDKAAFLLKNNLVQDGYRFRMLMSTEDKITHLGMRQDVAESMYRTLMHNKDLMAAEGVRQLALGEGLLTIADKVDMEKLITKLTFNYTQGYRGDKIEVEPFLHLTMPYNDLSKLLKDTPMLNRYYKIPDNVTSFNGFNKNIQLVQRGSAEILLGHTNFSIFKNNHPTLAKWERAYKQISSLVKQRMVVLSPAKLANDTIATLGMLSVMGMDPMKIYKGYKQGTAEYRDYAKGRTELVALDMALLAASPTDRVVALKRRDSHKKKLESLPFHDAFTAGFIQSHGTGIITTDADTISGLQKNIHEIINKYTNTKEGNPNTLYKAIKWFQTVGVNVDEVLLASGKYAETKNVTVGGAIVKMAKMLKEKKADKDVAGYISELLLLPGSTAVNVGGAYMVGSDTIGKYVLQQWLLTQPNKQTGAKYTKKEAAYVAMRQLIDYRPNMPKEIKTLSDYNILLFPSFWMNIQRALFNLAKSHPISSLSAYGLSAALGQEDTSIFMQNIISKQEGFNGLVHVPMGVNAQWVTDLLNG